MRAALILALTLSPAILTAQEGPPDAALLAMGEGAYRSHCAECHAKPARLLTYGPEDPAARPDWLAGVLSRHHTPPEVQAQAIAAWILSLPAP
jgi:mono/diheme cytochrome c family protein